MEQPKNVNMLYTSNVAICIHTYRSREVLEGNDVPNKNKSVEKGFEQHIYASLKNKSIAAEENVYTPKPVPTPFKN